MVFGIPDDPDGLFKQSLKPNPQSKDRFVMLDDPEGFFQEGRDAPPLLNETQS